MEGQNLLRSKISTPGDAMLKRRLGGGFYHSVHLAEKDGEFFAIKTYDLKKLEADLRSEALKDQIDTEVKALTLLCHPNVMNLEDCFRKASTTRLVLRTRRPPQLDRQERLALRRAGPLHPPSTRRCFRASTEP
jgi:hypothetical protein